jgi:RNA polymerase sigma-70 factor (ECF subfamily)
MANRLGDTTSPTLLEELARPVNNDAAWRTFLNRYLPLIHGWCHRRGLNHDEAEEVSEAVLTKLVTALRKFLYDPAGRFRSWLGKVVDNEIHSLRRRAARHPADRGSGHPEVHRTLEHVEAPGDVGDLVKELEEVLEQDLRLARQVTARVRSRVQKRTWRAFWLTAMESRPAGDVARELGMTVAAVYVAKNRVGRLLREEGSRLRGQAEGRGREQ